MERSNLPEVRNPVLALPAFAAIQSLDAPTRKQLSRLIFDLRGQALDKASESLRKNKYMMFAYWKCVAVYAGHIARALVREPKVIDLARAA